MSKKDVPIWVWDMLANIVEYEETHPEGMACILEATNSAVPSNVWEIAEVIARYRRERVTK